MTVRPGATVFIRQARTAVFNHLYFGDNVLLQIRAGAKILRDSQSAEFRAETGQFLYLRHGDVFTVQNIPDAGGEYLASGLCFAADLIAEHQRDQPPDDGGDGPLCIDPTPALTEAVARAEAALQDDGLPDSVQRLRLREVLAWLDTAGASHGHARKETVTARLRRLLSSAPDQDWRAPAVARELGMSEASLRRALARENGSFSALLADVRLSSALALIQTTSRSLTEIALDSGFASPSHFSVTFRKRFGISPMQLRKRAD